MIEALYSLRRRGRLWYTRQANDNNLAVPERGEDVRVGLGQTDGLYGQLQGEAGDHLHGVEVPQTEVSVLVSVQKEVVTGEEP